MTDGAGAQAQSQGTHPHMLVTDLTRVHWVLTSVFTMKRGPTLFVDGEHQRPVTGVKLHEHGGLDQVLR